MNTIEAAGLEDLDGVRELNTLLKNHLKEIDDKDFYWNTDAYVKAAILRKHCFVVSGGTEIKGAMVIEDLEPDYRCPAASLAIGTLSVRPEFRRNGIGIQLAEYAKKMARKENKRLIVESFLEFRQLRFYQRLGFKAAPRKEYRGKPYHVLFIDSQNT